MVAQEVGFAKNWPGTSQVEGAPSNFEGPTKWKVKFADVVVEMSRSDLEGHVNAVTLFQLLGEMHGLPAAMRRLLRIDVASPPVKVGLVLEKSSQLDFFQEVVSLVIGEAPQGP